MGVSGGGEGEPGRMAEVGAGGVGREGGVRNAVFAKHGSEYGRPGRSKVITREGTTTFVAARGRMPRLPWKVSALRLEP